MAVTLTNNGNGTSTLSATYTGPTATMNSVLEDAAHGFWNSGLGNHGADGNRLWSAVTLQEKRDILDAALKNLVTQMAKDYHVVASTEAARATAVAEGSSYNF